MKAVFESECDPGTLKERFQEQSDDYGNTKSLS